MNSTHQEEDSVAKYYERAEMHKRAMKIREFIIAMMPVDDSPLSMRETEVLRELSKGKTRRKIAKELYIDLETVRSHIRTIYIKLGVHMKEDAVKVARENGYLR